MRRTHAQAAFTRVRVLEAALTAFAEIGVRAATLEDVAARAGVTRGAVYWHFADKAALVTEVIDSLRWPLDIGSDLTVYQAHPWPLRLLREQLWQQIAHSMADPWQWRAVKLALHPCIRTELPAQAMARVERATTQTVLRLGRVMTIAYRRHQLRAGLRPVPVARCLHAVGVGVLSECVSDPAPAPRHASLLCLDLFMRGASGDAPGD